MNIDMKKVEKLAQELVTVENCNKELKKIQSKKCRLAKNKFMVDYDQKMLAILSTEQLIKEAKSLLSPKKKFVTDFDDSDINVLDFDETMKAIRSIQSAICNCQHETADINDNEKYWKYKDIENRLKEHKETVKPVDDSFIRKTDLITIIDSIKTAGNVSTERILEMLETLI